MKEYVIWQSNELRTITNNLEWISEKSKGKFCVPPQRARLSVSQNMDTHEGSYLRL